MKNVIFSVLLILTASVAYAQPGKPDGKVPDQSQDVVKNFDAKLLETEKVRINPVLPPIDTTTKVQSYNVPNKVLQVEYQPPRMRPVGMPQEKNAKPYYGYAKLGYGLPNSPYGEAAYRFGDPKEYLVGIKAKYHAAEDKKVENQRFSRLNTEATGTFFAPIGIAIDGKLGFDQDQNQYYGYNFINTDTVKKSFSREATKQSVGVFSAMVKAYNSARTVADFNYAATINFTSLSDNFSSKETDFNLRLEGTKWFNERHPLALVIRTEFTKYDTANGGKSQSLNNIYLQPSFTFKSDLFSIKLGANLISHEDIFYPKPDIEANLSLAGNKLGVFAGWRGDFTKNNYRNLLRYNPFLYTRQIIENTNTDEFYGGLKGSLNILDYSVQTGWSSNKNLALFVRDTATENSRVFGRFKTIYDTVNIFNIRGAVTMTPVTNLEITVTASQNFYTAKQQKFAWGLPSLDLNTQAKYTVLPATPKSSTTAALKASLFVQNGVNFLNEKNIADRLEPLFDLSLGGEIFFTKNIGAFLDVNNLLNLKRQRWQNYPTFGLNILGGISARF